MGLCLLQGKPVIDRAFARVAIEESDDLVTLGCHRFGFLLFDDVLYSGGMICRQHIKRTFRKNILPVGLDT